MDRKDGASTFGGGPSARSTSAIGIVVESPIGITTASTSSIACALAGAPAALLRSSVSRLAGGLRGVELPWSLPGPSCWFLAFCRRFWYQTWTQRGVMPRCSASLRRSDSHGKGADSKTRSRMQSCSQVKVWRVYFLIAFLSLSTDASGEAWIAPAECVAPGVGLAECEEAAPTNRRRGFVQRTAPMRAHRAPESAARPWPP
mmetsp:Transcript_14703/g.39189  ORF Transcript_14703/g.39189 Transcript_14703/m.39189 type:complete len:202 (+) Transcript_14703:1314-1919(+)